MMRAKLVVPLIAVAGVLVISGLIARHVLAPRHTPAGQPPLTKLTSDSLGTLRDAFNASSGEPRLLVLVSPT